MSEAAPAAASARTVAASRGCVAGIVGAAVAAVALRLATLSDQVLGDDELHAIRAALDWPLGRILTTYRLQDHSIPLTALYRLALDAGVRLGEMHQRAPVLLASLLSVGMFTVWCARRIGPRTACVFAWLLAASPMLVLYGRIVRSYAPVLLLAGVAAGAFLAFVEGGRARHAALYVGAGAAAVWFHLGAAPFVVAAGLFGVLCALVAPPTRGAARLWRELIAVGAALAVGVALFAWPARESLLALAEAKRAAGGVAPSVVFEWFQLQSGSRWAGVGVAFWALAGAGAWALWRDGERTLVAYGLWLVAGHAAGLALLSPEFRSVILLNRWMLVVLPVVLLFVAHGTAAAAASVGDRLRLPRAGWALVALVGVGWFATTPLARPDFWRSSFQHHYDWLRVTREPARFDADERLATILATLPAGSIVEFPWHPFWGLGRSFYAHQRAHGRRVLVSNEEPFFRDRRLAWRNFVPLEREALLASGARLVVVHAELPSEEAELARRSGGPGRISTQDPPYQVLRTLGRRGIARMRTLFGDAHVVDDGLWLWDLDRLRRDVPSAEQPGA